MVIVLGLNTVTLLVALASKISRFSKKSLNPIAIDKSSIGSTRTAASPTTSGRDELLEQIAPFE